MFKSLNKGAYSILLVIAIVIICMVLIGGIVVWKYLEALKGKEETLEKNKDVLSEKPSEKSSVPEEEITEWESYRYENKEYGYEIKYPSNWELFISAPVLEWDVFISGQIVIVRWAEKGVPGSRVEIVPRENKLNREPELFFRELYQLYRYGSALEGLKLDSEDDMIFNECQAKKMVYSSENPEISYTKITYLIQESDKIIYDLTLKTYELSKINDIFDQMLSSFKF